MITLHFPVNTKFFALIASSSGFFSSTFGVLNGQNNMVSIDLAFILSSAASGVETNSKYLVTPFTNIFACSANEYPDPSFLCNSPKNTPPPINGIITFLAPF